METGQKIKKMNIPQQSVYNYILERIMDKRLPVGSRIPTEMELAGLLKTNRMNVHNALNHLEEHGLLFRNKRGGTTVACMPSSFMIGELKRKVNRFVTVLNPLLPEFAHLHWNPEITGVLKKELEQHGLSLNVVNVCGIADEKEMAKKLKKLAHEGAAALLCISCMDLNDMLAAHPEIFFNYHRNVFVFARDIVQWNSFPYNIVSVDLFNEGVIAAEHCCAQGYDHVFYGYIKAVNGRDWVNARRDGLRCGLQRMSGGTIRPNEVILEESAEELITAVSRGKKVMLVAAADHIAVDFINKIRSATGKTPGTDYGVISFDNDEKTIKYGLTTIVPPLHEIGKALAELIIAEVEHESTRTTFIKIKSQLLKRTTS